MRASLVRFLVLLALVVAAPLAHAQVFHCVGTHGEPVYSGEPCGTPASRAPADAATVSRFAHPCATAPTELVQALARAFQTRDVNVVAGMLLWQDVGAHESQQALRALAAWLAQPLAGIKVLPTAGPPDAGTVAAPASPAATVAPTTAYTGIEVTTAAATRQFGLVHQDGCWWLTF